MDELQPTATPGALGAAQAAVGAAEQPGDPGANGKVIERNPPEVDKATAEFVKEWVERVEDGKDYWKDVFGVMRRTAKFASGKQWPGQTAEDDRYIANITLRHISQRVASIYAKNPRVRALPKPKLYSETWDGSPEMLRAAKNTLAAAQDPAGYEAAAATGQVEPASMDPVMAQTVLDEAQQEAQQKQLLGRMGKTLEIVAQYSLDEPIPKFKTQAKQLVRRVLTCRVGYVKLGYQRQMDYSADTAARIKDVTDKLKQIQSLSADLADGEMEQDSAEGEELRQSLQTLQAKKEVIVREGLTFSFPKAWSIIPDHENTTQLKGFVGSEWIAEEYIFTPKQVQKIYGVDVGQTYTQHTVEGKRGDKRKNKDKFCAVYEVHDIVNQQVFTVCAGYPDYLKAPSNEDIELEAIHPYFALTFNDVESTGESAMESIYPPSDAELLKSMAVEYNRAREGLRVHRLANRPATVSAKGVFDEKSKELLGTHADHENIELNISKADDITKLVQPKPTVPIQKELYDVEHVFVDTQRVVGDQAANLGGTSGSTATESSIAESSRVTTLQSSTDDLDEFLTDLMRASGQVLLNEMSVETVKRIAGPGAAWPQVSRKEVQEELMLDIRAGSSGRPNKGMRLQAVEKSMPLILQIPGAKPKKILEFVLNEIDEGMDTDDFIDDSLPSITAMNNMAKPNLSPAPGNAAQASAGAMNAPGAGESGAKTQNLGGSKPNLRAIAQQLTS